MRNFVNTTLKAVNTFPSFFLIFIVLFLYKAGFRVTGNEKQYLVYAKQFANPDWMPYSAIVKDFPGTRLLFQVLFGWLLDFLSFGQMAFLGRTLTFLLFAFPLRAIFRRFKLNNVEILVCMLLFWIPNQALFAGGWMVKDFETKVIAYFFMLYALLKLLDGKIVQSYVFLAFSTLFHVLVGGWFTVVFSVYFLFEHFNVKKIGLGGLLWVLLVSPLVAYLATGLVGGEKVINGIHTDWIYTAYRNPHHTALFSTVSFFFEKHFAGVLASFILLLVSVFVYKKSQDAFNKKISLLQIVLFSQQMLFVVVAFFDKNGSLMKTYPFRTSTLSAFLLIFQITYMLKLYVPKYNKLSAYAPFVAFSLLVVATIKLAGCSATTYGNITWEKPQNIRELGTHIKTHTKETDVFLVFLKRRLDERKFEDFIMETERDRLVIWKYIPTESKAIYDWYRKMTAKDSLYIDTGYFQKMRREFKIDYLITDQPVNWEGLGDAEVYRNEEYFLYKVGDELK